jgi:hypothetical protein
MKEHYPTRADMLLLMVFAVALIVSALAGCASSTGPAPAPVARHSFIGYGQARLTIEVWTNLAGVPVANLLRTNADGVLRLTNTTVHTLSDGHIFAFSNPTNFTD